MNSSLPCEADEILRHEFKLDSNNPDIYFIDCLYCRDDSSSNCWKFIIFLVKREKKLSYAKLNNIIPPTSWSSGIAISSSNGAFF